MRNIIRPPRKVDNYLKEPIVFYCKDCEKIVEVKPFGRKFVYRCAICGTKNVAFGTEKAIRSFYRYEEGKVDDTASAKAGGNLQTAAKKAEVLTPEEAGSSVVKDSKASASDVTSSKEMSIKKPIPNEK